MILPKLTSPTSLGIAAIATVRYLLVLDLDSRQVWPLENGRPEYYGISWFPGSEHLVLSHSNLDNASLHDLQDYAQSEKGTLSHGSFTSCAFLSQPHQLLCAPDGKIICTNTGRNSVVVVDPNNLSQMQEVRISESRWDRLGDQTCGDHLNSVFLKGDRLYVIAHGHSRGASLATFHYPSLELISREKIAGRTGLHNILVTDQGQALSCHSELGGVVDLSENRVVWHSGCPVYTRGLAATEDFVLIGESERTPRAQRPSSDSGVWLLDRHNWQAVDYYSLGPYGCVHEVRLLDSVDQAHHGHPFAGRSTLLSDNLQTKMTVSKLDAARSVRYCSEAWSGFATVYGAPTPSADGALTAAPGNLCLLTEKSTPKCWQVRVRYSLDHSAHESHFSIVSYRGLGCDTDMHALLVQPLNDQHAWATLWLHDGVGWHRQADVNSCAFPLRGIALFEATEDIVLRVNGELVLRLPIGAMSLQNGVLGIRFVGSTIALEDLKSQELPLSCLNADPQTEPCSQLPSVARA